MDESLAILEKRVEEAELILGTSSDGRAYLQVNSLWESLKDYCRKPDHTDEVLKRPIDQLNAILNVLSDPSDLSLGEKVQTVNAQSGLLAHRIELLSNITDLTERLDNDALTKVVSAEGQIDDAIEQYVKLVNYLHSLTSVVSTEQSRLDKLFNILQNAVTKAEATNT